MSILKKWMNQMREANARHAAEKEVYKEAYEKSYAPAKAKALASKAAEDAKKDAVVDARSSTYSDFNMKKFGNYED